MPFADDCADCTREGIHNDAPATKMAALPSPSDVLKGDSCSLAHIGEVYGNALRGRLCGLHARRSPQRHACHQDGGAQKSYDHQLKEVQVPIGCLDFQLFSSMSPMTITRDARQAQWLRRGPWRRGAGLQGNSSADLEVGTC